MTQMIPPECTWAIACGSALALAGVEYTPSDIDVFAPSEDVGQIWRSLSGAIEVFSLHPHTEDGITSVWGRYVWDGIEIDIVGDFVVCRGDMEFSWDGRHPCWSNLTRVMLNGGSIPVFSLEDLLLLYLALPGGEIKLHKTASALRSRGPNLRYLSQFAARGTALAARIGQLIEVG